MFPNWVRIGQICDRYRAKFTVVSKLIAFSTGAQFSVSTLFFYAGLFKCEYQHVRGWKLSTKDQLLVTV